MTIKERILELLSDGNEYYYRDIATKLNVSKNFIAVTLCNMTFDGLVETPTVTITVTKNKVGYYKLKAKKIKK